MNAQTDFTRFSFAANYDSAYLRCDRCDWTTPVEGITLAAVISDASNHRCVLRNPQ